MSCENVWLPPRKDPSYTLFIVFNIFQNDFQHVFLEKVQIISIIIGMYKEEEYVESLNIREANFS